MFGLLTDPHVYSTVGDWLIVGLIAAIVLVSIHGWISPGNNK